MNKERYQESEIPDIQIELFRKYFIDEARPRLEEIFGEEESKKLLDRLAEVFKNTEGWGDFENRIDVTLHNFTHPLAIQDDSKREKIANVLYGIAAERLTEAIENMRNSNTGTDNILPFEKK